MIRVAASIFDGSNVAAIPRGVGNEVAPIVVKPVKHSSCATAGIPRRVSEIRRVCRPINFLAPSAAAIGRVPNTRVNWPNPCFVASSHGNGWATSAKTGTLSTG